MWALAHACWPWSLASQPSSSMSQLVRLFHIGVEAGTQPVSMIHCLRAARSRASTDRRHGVRG